MTKSRLKCQDCGGVLTVKVCITVSDYDVQDGNGGGVYFVCGDCGNFKKYIRLDLSETTYTERHLQLLDIAAQYVLDDTNIRKRQHEIITGDFSGAIP